MTKAEIEGLFSRFAELNVLIIGDAMLDSYVWGRVERISPEAPVPVVTVTRHENRLGGAANVARNIKALGAAPLLAAVVGNDHSGDAFVGLLEKEGMDSGGILRSSRPTTVKTRIIGNNHQLLRVDEENDTSLDPELAFSFRQHVLSLIETRPVDVIIFEDYDKGLIDSALIEAIVAGAEKKNIPVAVDPKQRNFTAYKRVTLFKPNLKEIREGLKTEINPSDTGSIVVADRRLRELLGHKISLVTLSEQGIFISDPLQSFRLPAHVRNIADVSGAGDTVISVAALCLAAGTEPALLAMLSNLAGGLVCEKVGVVPVDAGQLLREATRMLAG